jgi:hypothetical protein
MRSLLLHLMKSFPLSSCFFALALSFLFSAVSSSSLLMSSSKVGAVEVSILAAIFTNNWIAIFIKWWWSDFALFPSLRHLLSK